MNFEPKFISASDFYDYWGIDLIEKLKNGGNSSNKANIFLRRIENNVMAWIDANTFRNVHWDHLSEFQLEQFQYALLEQAMYVYRNSDISLDSGYDPEKGIIVDKQTLEGLIICTPALNFLKLAGLYNLNVTNRMRFTGNLL